MDNDRLCDANGASVFRMFTRHASWSWLLTCAALLSMSSVAESATCYVDAAASGAGDGTSWTDADTGLQPALGNAICNEIWVAQGVYKPVVPADVGNVTSAEKGVSFAIGPGVAVYGGFAGGETIRGARNPLAHATILSGDIDNNDTGANGVDADTSKIVGSNSFHVVVISGTAVNPITATTVLDGFTLTGGSAGTVNGGALWCKGSGVGNACSPTLANLAMSGNKAVSGGAIALDGYSGGVSSPTLSNVVFSGNSASQFGGAMYNNAQLAGSNSSPTLTNVAFIGNSSANFGGAMFNDGSGGVGATSSPTLKNVTFSGNSASNGGAMYNNGAGGDSSPTLTNVTFFGNSASGNGGAMLDRGTSGASYPKLINATFNGNSATNGGAIYNVDNSGVTLIASIVWGDSATGNGPEFYLQGGSVSLYDSVIQNGCVVNDCGGTGNISGNPNLGGLVDNGGFVRTLMPGAGSSAINTITCGYGDETPLIDARGAVRPDSLSSGPTRCDMGAVEADSLPGDYIFSDRFGGSTWDDY